MTHTNLDIIRAACIVANPEIASDTRGYKQEQLDEAYREYLVICKQVADEDAPQSRTWALPAMAFKRVKKLSAALAIFQDRPIRLADVLLAIENTRDKNLKKWYAVSTSGLFLENKVEKITPRIYAHPMISTLRSWNLRKDSLEEQSEETITFLAELLS